MACLLSRPRDALDLVAPVNKSVAQVYARRICPMKRDSRFINNARAEVVRAQPATAQRLADVLV
jgi:hypothetical protein